MSLTKPKQIHLVRHGTSTANISHILAGRTPGVVLTPEGEKEAQDVGRYLQENASLPITHIFYSPLERTKQTARHISQQLAKSSPKKITQHRSPFAIEMDYGDWSGMKISRLAIKPLWKNIQSHPSRVRFPQGESFLEAQSRLIDGINEIVLPAIKPGESAIIVSHGDPIKIILSHFVGATLDTFQKIAINPGSLSTLTISDHGAMVSLMNLQPNKFIAASTATIGGELNKSSSQGGNMQGRRSQKSKGSVK